MNAFARHCNKNTCCPVSSCFHFSSSHNNLALRSNKDFLNYCELITCSGDNHMWSCTVAQGYNLLSAQDINPARLNSALKVSEA